MRRYGDNGKTCSRAKTQDADDRQDKKHQDRYPAADSANAAEPLSKAKPKNIQKCNEGKTRQRKDKVVTAAMFKFLAMRKHEEQASGAEIKYRGEVGKIAHPVRPSSHETGEVSEGALCPDVNAAFLRIARGKFDDTCRKWNKEAKACEKPDDECARPGCGGGCNPAQAERTRYVKQR